MLQKTTPHNKVQGSKEKEVVEKLVKYEEFDSVQ